MSVIDLPCEYEEWWDYQKIYILLSHLRSMRDLNLLISSHTRTGDNSPTSKCLGALKGLVTFLTEYYTPEEQMKFVSHTLPFVARAAGLLEERVPLSGIPCLQKQENSALVLGRKVILSILANAFLCTFPPCGDNTFSFEKIFAVFQSTAAASKKREQAEKLHCILCYFDRAADDKCNLSCVVTFRRQVLAFKELPRVVEWENNTAPLCPFEVDEENSIDESGGHTLQVCFSSNCLGGGVFGGGCSEEEFRFCACPELLVTRLIMEPMDENEAVIITGVERFAKVTGTKFAGGYCDESERDVFGNLLNSLLALDTQPLVVRSQISQQQQQLDQYHADFILWELNKAYTGFHCQQDRGDISTELLALTVKRGSLAFVAEDYPECGAPFRITSRQSDLGNIPQSTAEYVVRGPAAVVLETSGGMSSPLSPIPEISETPSFPTFLADDIVQAGLKQVEGSTRHEQGGGGEGAAEEMATKLVQSMFENPAELLGEDSNPIISGIGLTLSMDDLATALASSILKASAQNRTQEAAASVLVKTMSAEELEKRSNFIARSIIADVLTSSSPLPPKITTPQTMGEPTSSSSSIEGLSSMAVGISGNILSEVLKKCSVRPQPPVAIQVEGKERRISSLTNMVLHEYINEMTNLAIHEGISLAQESPPTASLLERPQAIPQARPEAANPQADPSGIDVVQLAESLVAQSIQNSLKRVQLEIGWKEGKSEPLFRAPFKKQLPARQGLPLGTPPGGTSPLTSSPANGFPEGPPPTQTALPGGPKPQDSPPVVPREPFDPDGDTQSTASNLNSRLLTPMSSRAGYAWSIASTRDEDSRPVSPTDLNKLGLSLSNNTDEFSSLFSDIVINNAISNVTGENISPHTISTEKKEAQDHTSLPSSSKIGIFLSTLGEAETPSDQSVTTPYNTTWQNMRRQLLRPVTTGPWKCSGEGGVRGDPQLMAMVQWMAASASGRPRLFYYSLKEEAVQELARVTSQLRAKYCTVGQLCQSLVAFGKKAPEEKQKGDLFTFLSQNS